MMRPIEDALPLVAPYAPDAPEPLALRCILHAAIEFCQRSRSWRVSDSFTATGEPDAVTVPIGAILMEIAACALDGRPLDPKSINDLADDIPDWRTETPQANAGRWYVSPEFGTVQIVPRSTGSVTAELIVKPRFDAKVLPDFLFDHYADVIEAGAVGNLLVMPDVAWANPSLASVKSRSFQGKLDSLSTVGHAGQQKAPVRTKAQFM